VKTWVKCRRTINKVHIIEKKKMKHKSEPVQLSGLLQTLLKSAFSQRGVQDGGLFLEWKKVVGDEIAGFCAPEKITYDGTQAQRTTLHIRVAPAAILYVSSFQGQILAHLHRYYGYPKIQELRFFQAPLPRASATAKTSVPKGVLPENERRAVERIKNEALQRALLDLGSVLYGAKK
jgi:hypothetical protein